MYIHMYDIYISYILTYHMHIYIYDIYIRYSKSRGTSRQDVSGKKDEAGVEAECQNDKV